MLCKAYGNKSQQHKCKTVREQRVIAELIEEYAHEKGRYRLRGHGYRVIEARVFANVACTAYLPNHRKRVHGYSSLRKAYEAVQQLVDSGLLDDEKAETARRYLYETYGELPEA